MTTSEDLCKQHGMLIVQEAQILKDCVRELPEFPVIINIGAGVGTSAVAMLEERPDAFVFSVDINPVPLERTSLRVCNVEPNRCVRLLGKSWHVGEYFPFAVDMVFVDGDHGNYAVERDINTWIPKIKDNGIAAFHDYKHPNVPELTNVVNDKMAKHEVIAEHRYLIAYKISW